MNCMSRNIGIYCVNRNEAERLFDVVKADMPADAIKILRTHYPYQIFMQSETIYTFLCVDDNARGYAFHEAYIQPGIDINVYRTIICPCVELGYGRIYLVEEQTDFWFRNKLADGYYNSLRRKENDDEVSR